MGLPQYVLLTMVSRVCRRGSFVYELPPEFNTALLADELPRYVSCRTSMYAAEVVIHELLQNRWAIRPMLHPPSHAAKSFAFPG